MAECSECGRESMSFTCRYCGEKFCSEHRLPEKHGCQKLEESLEKEKEEKDGWFQEKEVKNPAPSQKREFRKPSLMNEMKRTLTKNYTLSIIGFTSLVFMLQMFLGESPTSVIFYDLFILKPSLQNILAQPWTLFTVLFIHAGLFHLFANMVTLYFFGKPVENIVGGKDFLKFYFGSGLAASIGFIAFRNIIYLLHGSTLSCAVPGMCGSQIPVLGAAVGASGAVVAAFAAVSMIYPDAEVLLYFIVPMRIKTALNLFIGIESVNLATKLLGYSLPFIGNFASSAHLAGLVVGVWYGKKLREKIGTRRTVFEIMGR